MTVRFNLPQGQVFDSNGNPGVGWKLYFYDPGTTTPKDVYSDSELETPLSQPLLSDSAGRFASAFMDPSLYRVILKDSSDVTKIDADDYDPGLAAGFGVSSLVGVAQGGTGANNAAAARANLGAASSSSVSIVQTDITGLQTAVATGVNGDGEFGDLASKDTADVTDLATGFGVIVRQEVRDDTPDATTTTTNTPAWDSSAPQNTEGTQFFSVSITPKSASNTLEIHLHISGEASSAVAVAAIFKDSDAAAVAAKAMSTYGGTGHPVALDLYYRVSAGSTDARTYACRIGVSAGTFRINGSGSNTLGGTITSFLSVKELQTV